MHLLCTAVGSLVIAATLVCWVYIGFKAFRHDPQTASCAGLFGLDWLYDLYYAVCEFEHPYKWALVTLALAGMPVGAALLLLV